MERDYESSFRELENIIRELESKDISLEDSIKKYEKGIELYKYLNNTLKAVSYTHLTLPTTERV